MAKMIHFLPMALPRIILVAFAGAQGLDVFGPAEAFAAVARAVGTPAYDVLLAASRAGTLRATSGIALGARALGRLRPRDARVLRLYFGFDGVETMTLEAIGERLGITRERVRQIKDRALARIRHSDCGVLASFTEAR
jgi:hypothetical protein